MFGMWRLWIWTQVVWHHPLPIAKRLSLHTPKLKLLFTSSFTALLILFLASLITARLIEIGSISFSTLWSCSLAIPVMIHLTSNLLFYTPESCRSLAYSDYLPFDEERVYWKRLRAILSTYWIPGFGLVVSNAIIVHLLLKLDLARLAGLTICLSILQSATIFLISISVVSIRPIAMALIRAKYRCHEWLLGRTVVWLTFLFAPLIWLFVPAVRLRSLADRLDWITWSLPTAWPLNFLSIRPDQYSMIGLIYTGLALVSICWCFLLVRKQIELAQLGDYPISRFMKRICTNPNYVGKNECENINYFGSYEEYLISLHRQSKRDNAELRSRLSSAGLTSSEIKCLEFANGGLPALIRWRSVTIVSVALSLATLIVKELLVRALNVQYGVFHLLGGGIVLTGLFLSLLSFNRPWAKLHYLPISVGECLLAQTKARAISLLQVTVILLPAAMIMAIVPVSVTYLPTALGFVVRGLVVAFCASGILTAATLGMSLDLKPYRWRNVKWIILLGLSLLSSALFAYMAIYPLDGISGWWGAIGILISSFIFWKTVVACYNSGVDLIQHESTL